MTHTYELSPEGYKEIESGTRTFLLLKDKGYTLGDTFLIQEPKARKEMNLHISYLEKEVPGMKAGYVIVGLAEKVVSN